VLRCSPPLRRKYGRGMVQNRVTLFVKPLCLSMTVTCPTTGTYISLDNREGSHECYLGPSELEPCHGRNATILRKYRRENELWVFFCSAP
jgi:hypothetical protein